MRGDCGRAVYQKIWFDTDTLVVGLLPGPPLSQDNYFSEQIDTCTPEHTLWEFTDPLDVRSLK